MTPEEGDEQIRKQSFSQQNVNKQLQKAIYENNLSEVEQLLARKPNLEPQCPYNLDCKPLVYAAAMGRLEIVKLLIEAGADPNGRGAYDSVPLIQAYWAESYRSNSGESKAASDQTISEIQSYLLKNGANPNIPNAFGISFFMGVAAKCDMDLLVLCLENGVNVNATYENRTRTKKGKIPSEKNTALHLAVKNQCYEAISLLLEHNADVHAKNAAGMSPIDLAREMKDDVAIKLLLE